MRRSSHGGPPPSRSSAGLGDGNFVTFLNHKKTLKSQKWQAEDCGTSLAGAIGHMRLTLG